MAHQYTLFLVGHMEPGFHRFVIGDTFRIRTFHDSLQFIGNENGTFFHHLIILDNVDDRIGGNYTQTAYLFMMLEPLSEFSRRF